MKNDRVNSLLRSYVKSVLSPNQDDILFVSRIYQSFNDLLGVNNCIQIGSYPRYTAIKPLHDLDILYIIGDWADRNIIPFETLNALATNFRKEYKNPTNYEVKIVVQTHSISFKYMKGVLEVFAVDLVPALKKGLNEFNRNMFYVPEVIKKNRGENRTKFYSDKLNNKSEIIWIKTDPIGYIEVASQINKNNTDFRKSVKFVKGWKNLCKQQNEEFKLKSFHIEQIVTKDFGIKNKLEIFEAIFKFFTELKEKIKQPNILDRADNTKFIDEYLNELTDYQRELIYQSIDAVLISFENIDNTQEIEKVIKSGFYKRNGIKEQFLFDQKIPVLIDDNFKFKIDGYMKRHDGFREFQASLKVSNGIVDTKNSIEFKTIENNTNCNLLKWKVKNDNISNEPRGEITDRTTSQNPEKTAYLGNHYVECFAIKDGICVARDKLNVIVRK
jgi:Adenylyl/Guanylyl and SMODS C-terminal sensor domain